MKGMDLDAGKTPEQLYAERTNRIEAAFHLQQPDRIPIKLPIGYMLAEIGGVTKQELHDNPEKCQELLEKVALEYQPDAISGPFPIDPKPHLILGDRMTRWPGYGLNPNAQFQFVEKEFMKVEDYDEFLEDPADWAIRVYLPRAFSALEGFSLLPPLGMALYGCYGVLLGAGKLTEPPLAASLQAYARAAQAVAEGMAVLAKNDARLTSLGFPSGPPHTVIEAPFDLMSDTLRGMRGIMLDLLCRPDKLLAAEDKVSRLQLKFAVACCHAAGLKYCFIPLHRGSDGFMSIPHFERFYWSQLRDMILALIDHGIVPWVFYEGCWDRRLKYLAELPKGKSVGWFQDSDIFKVKEMVGDTMCIMGGMPNPMLVGGTVAAVREHTKKVCEVLGKGGGFVMTTAIGEMSSCKPDLVKAWVEATREYGVY